MDSLALYVAARALLASLFITLGAQRLAAALGGAGTAPAPGRLVFGTLELLAGLAILIGWQARWVALLMAAVLVVDALAAHPFWQSDPPAREEQRLHFVKNLAISGGLLLLAWAETVRSVFRHP
ncbi:DoxX family protein [Roseomonas sp. OT10]|uniref:DoxX family protein n=1 Tax=Roseomonas cutis TaxID=2897332 RepID=UPI001E623CA2|nr:DoxX family protein [Roseomonas sp. OT10]UFN50177.1 DoxX family protein [Roseomonas sp. OT10]